MANFKTLQPLFAAAGVPLATKDVRDIITEQRGAATKVLYQLRVAHEAPPPTAKRPSLTGATLEWKRTTDSDLIDHPDRRSDVEFVRRAIEGGVKAL